MIKVCDIKEFDDLIFKTLNYTAKSFGFNINSFVEICSEDYNLKDVKMYYHDNVFLYPNFYMNIDLKNNNIFVIELHKEVITIKYYNKRGYLHRFNNWAVKKIRVINNKKPVLFIEEYILFGKYHNLKGPALMFYDYYNNKFTYSYYIKGLNYNLDNYCKILSKRMVC